MSVEIASPRPAKYASNVRIPALGAMVGVGFAFVILGAAAWAFGAFQQSSDPVMAALALTVGGAIAGFGVWLLLTAWVLVAVKQMFHAYANGWRSSRASGD